MNCEICSRPASDDRAFNCALCAQAAVYRSRLDSAQALLENENLEKDVEHHLAGGRRERIPSREQKAQGPHPSTTIKRVMADQAALDESTADILSHVKSLREEIKHMKLDVAKRRAKLVRRRKDLAIAKDRQSLHLLEPLRQHEENAKRTQHKWEEVHQQIMTQRLTRCIQTARFFSLQQQKRRKGLASNDVYSIGFLSIPDLKDLNSMSLTFPKS